MSENGARKPTRPFLKKGQGTARFGLQRPPESPLVQLPRFTPTNSLPTSARTLDSGISNEDETRPPTTASLPLDRPSPAAVLEEAEEEPLEEVSAVPTFLPDSGASSLIEPASELSEDALRFRAMAEQMKRHAEQVQTMRSVSISPSTYTSDLSAPIGASTPITALPQSCLETPQARPFSVVNRANEAQTGISLVQRQQLPPPPPMNRRIRQKENVPHVYDQPEAVPGGQKDKRVRNLMIQLRDAIAHVDFAEEQVRKTGRMLHEQFRDRLRRMNEEHETRKTELEEEYRKKMEDVEEDNRTETERLKRERRDVERDRKILQKETGERHKEQAKLIEELRGKQKDAETQLAKQRSELRVRDEKLKKKDEELEKMSKEFERSKKNCATLEKRLRQMRNEKEKEVREEQLFANAAAKRNQNQTLTRTSSRGQLPSVSSTVSTVPSCRKSSTGSAKAVSFADNLNDVSVEPVWCENTMKPVEKTSGPSGPCTVYRDSLGEVTRVTVTAENGRLFEYSNGDRRWSSAAQSVLWYHFAIDGTVVIDLVAANIKIIYILRRQLEIKRPNNNTTLISLNRSQIRTELMHHCESNYFYTEIFDRDGTVLKTDMCGTNIRSKYAAGSKQSFRDDRRRYVDVFAFDDFELVESEMRIRWFRGETCVVKVFGREATNEKTLRFDVFTQSGDGQLEAVESRLTNGVSRKTAILEWHGPQ